MTDQSQMKESESWGSDSTAVRKLSVFPLMFFALYHTGSSQITLVGFIHSCIQQILFENTAENQTKPLPTWSLHAGGKEKASPQTDKYVIGHIAIASDV